MVLPQSCNGVSNLATSAVFASRTTVHHDHGIKINSTDSSRQLHRHVQEGDVCRPGPEKKWVTTLEFGSARWAFFVFYFARFAFQRPNRR